MIIIADTATDILESEAEALGIRLVTIDSSFGDVHCNRNTDEGFEKFYNLLSTSENLPVSSQPSPGVFLDIYEEAEEKNEDVLVITLSSKLSGTYNGAMLAKDMLDYDRIFIVDSLQASSAERIVVEHAVELRDKGLSAEEIAKDLESFKRKVTLMGVPSTLLYLKKGGRISNVKAALGSALDIKPLLKLVDGKIESFGSVRGLLHAKREIIKAFKNDNVDFNHKVHFGYSNDIKVGKEFMDKVVAECNLDTDLIHNVGPAIGTHIGPGAILIAYVLK